MDLSIAAKSTITDSEDVIIQILREIEEIIKDIIATIKDKIEELLSQLPGSPPLIDFINTLTELAMDFSSGDKSLENLEMIATNLASFVSQVDATLDDLNCTIDDIDELEGILDSADGFKDAVWDVKANLTQSTTIALTMTTPVVSDTTVEPTMEPTIETGTTMTSVPPYYAWQAFFHIKTNKKFSQFFCKKVSTLVSTIVTRCKLFCKNEVFP